MQMFQVWPPWWASRQQKAYISTRSHNSRQTVKIFNFGLFASIVVLAAIVRQLCAPPARMAPERCVPGWCGAVLRQEGKPSLKKMTFIGLLQIWQGYQVSKFHDVIFHDVIFHDVIFHDIILHDLICHDVMNHD